MRTGSAELLGDHLRHERDPRRAADEQHGGERPRARRCARSSVSLDELDGLPDHRADHRLELRPGDPHRRRVAGQHHRDVARRIRRQRLLGVDAAAPQLGDGRGALGVLAGRLDDLGGHVGERRTGTRPRRSRCRRAARCRPARSRARSRRPRGAAGRRRTSRRRGRRRAPSRPASTSADGGEVDRRRGRLGDQLGARQADVGERVAQRAELVLGPVRRVGDRRPASAAPPTCVGDGVDDPLRHQGGEPVGVVRRARQHQRDGIAEPPLELAGEPERLGRATPLGRRRRTAARRPRRRSPTARRPGTSPAGTTSTLPSRRIAAAVNVVPTSIPRPYPKRCSLPADEATSRATRRVARVYDGGSRRPAVGWRCPIAGMEWPTDLEGATGPDEGQRSATARASQLRITPRTTSRASASSSGSSATTRHRPIVSIAAVGSRRGTPPAAGRGARPRRRRRRRGCGGPPSSLAEHDRARRSCDSRRISTSSWAACSMSRTRSRSMRALGAAVQLGERPDAWPASSGP